MKRQIQTGMWQWLTSAPEDKVGAYGLSHVRKYHRELNWTERARLLASAHNGPH